MFKIIDCEQRTDQWLQARLGDYSASIFNKLITQTGKESTQARETNWRLVAERHEGRIDESFKSEAMIRGNVLEDDAFFQLNLAFGHNFTKVGYFKAINEEGEELGYGCSPDGFDFEKHIGAEIKCPSSHTHLEYLLGGVLPERYKAQVQGSMLVTGANKWIFYSYHPNYPPFYLEVERDDLFIMNLLSLLNKHCKIIKETTARLKEMLAEELEA